MVVSLIVFLMVAPLFRGVPAGLKAFYLSGLLPRQVEWLFCSWWVCFSMAPTQVLDQPDQSLGRLLFD